MASNALYDKILTPLQTLLRTLDPPLKFYFDAEDGEVHGAEWLTLLPPSDRFVQHLGQGETREYEIPLLYFRRIGGDWTLAKHLKPLSRRVEQVKELILNNQNYTPTSSGAWHHARIESTDYTPERGDEENPEDLAAVSLLLVLQIDERIA